MLSYTQIATAVTKKHRLLRKRYFAPLVKILAKYHVTPMHVSNFRIILIVPIVLLLPIYPMFASILILLGIVSDWVDGPLARTLQVSSDRGKFIDMFSDNVFYAGVIWGMMYLGVINALWGAYHLVLVAVFHVVAVIARNEGKKTDWIIKPNAISGQYKAVMYIIIFLYLWFNIDTVNITLWLVTGVMTIETVYHYIKIVRRWS